MESAKHLKVLVSADGEERVNLTMPIFSLNMIDTLIPEKVTLLLKERNFDLAGKISEIKASGYQPQTIFEMQTEEKSYRVWIE